MKPRIHLVCFSDERYRAGKERLVSSARRLGVEFVHAFSDVDIRKTTFYADHREILDLPRGAGYWLWKPYLIREILSECSSDEFVFYCDSGADLLGSPEAFLDYCTMSDGIWLVRNFARQNKYWTKRDAFVSLDCDRTEFHDADQVNAAFMMFRGRSQSAIDLVEEWLFHCCNSQLITDAPSVCGKPELPEFISHLHDQTLLSLVAAKRKLPLFRDPSNLGNHRKPSALRTVGEHLEMPYTDSPCLLSKYGTLVNHDRMSRKPVGLEKLIRTTKGLIRKWFPKEWKNPYFENRSLSATSKQNRNLLRSLQVDSALHLGDGQENKSGIEKQLRHVAQHRLGQPTIVDLNCKIVESLGSPVNYLGIGMESGWNLVTLLHYSKSGDFCIVDEHDLGDIVTSRLDETRQSALNLEEKSSPKPMLEVGEYVERENRNRVRHIKADCRNEGSWDQLRPSGFNLLYFSRIRWPEQLMQQWLMLEKRAVVDLENFVLVIDDSPGYVPFAVDKIHQRILTQSPKAKKISFKMYGVNGNKDHVHQVAMIVNLVSPPAWLSLPQQHP